MFEAIGATFGATLAGCLVLVGTAGAAVYLFMQRQQNNSKPQQNIPDDSEQMTFLQAQRLLYSEIRDVCEVALVRRNFNAVIPIDEDKKIPLLNVHMPGSSRKLLMTYSGTIVCGFDMKDAQILSDTDRRFKISLPPCKILDIYADVQSVKIFYKETGIFAANIDLEEQNALIDANLKTRAQSEIQEGLLLRADENARKLLHARIERTGLNDSFDIQILDSGANDVPALSAPQNQSNSNVSPS